MFVGLWDRITANNSLSKEERMPSEPFQVEPLDATFGAMVTNLKLAELDCRAFAELYETWLEYALLVFPAQHLSND